MIRSFRDKLTERFFNGEFAKKWSGIESAAERKLLMLNAAADLRDLRIPPANHLEALRGNRKGQHSIRINDQYRICFVWGDDNNAYEVEITDYHD
jgi:proteic killer suppression protein